MGYGQYERNIRRRRNNTSLTVTIPVLRFRLQEQSVPRRSLMTEMRSRRRVYRSLKSSLNNPMSMRSRKRLSACRKSLKKPMPIKRLCRRR